MYFVHVFRSDSITNQPGCILLRPVAALKLKSAS